MAVSIALYDHTVTRFANGSNGASDTYKLELLNNSAVFNAANTQKTQVDNAGAYEVSGNGWTTGGITLSNVVIATVNTNDAKFAADDITQTASGGNIGPAYKALLYNATDANSPPLAFINFDGALTATQGAPFIVTWDPAGIVTFTYT